MRSVTIFTSHAHDGGMRYLVGSTSASGKYRSNSTNLPPSVRGNTTITYASQFTTNRQSSFASVAVAHRAGFACGSGCTAEGGLIPTKRGRTWKDSHPAKPAMAPSPIVSMTDVFPYPAG